MQMLSRRFVRGSATLQTHTLGNHAGSEREEALHGACEHYKLDHAQASMLTLRLLTSLPALAYMKGSACRLAPQPQASQHHCS